MTFIKFFYLESLREVFVFRAFTTLSYTADGSCILAGGQSKNVCIYNVKESILLKKFEITQNRSLDNVDDFINRRKMTEFGNLDLIERREGGNVKIRLPGVRQGDMAARSYKPEVKVFCVEFSPTGTTVLLLIEKFTLSLHKLLYLFNFHISFNFNLFRVILAAFFV